MTAAPAAGGGIPDALIICLELRFVIALLIVSGLLRAHARSHPTSLCTTGENRGAEAAAASLCEHCQTFRLYHI